MSAEKTTKINRLLTSQPFGIVLQSDWLTEQGYNSDLQKRYRKGNWLKSIGTGAMIRTGDKVGYEGAIYALQTQSTLTVHPGGRTALFFLGKAHYLELSAKKAVLFGNKGERLPAWFQKHDWGIALDYYPTSFLPPDIGMVEVELKNFSINVSGAVRAFMECLYLAPEKQELMECFELMEGLNNLRPNQVQDLLEKCESVKVKRLFLYLAEKAGHEWFQYLVLRKVDLGHGKRSIVKNGVYVDKYKITVPKELEEHGKRSI
ncbi:type IV toxin-antitoxin system AbiEi family antitoxin [Chitinophaga horti]|uniref:Type IV toxin-antitoxin system AbiEi family antitoxin n=1 Tax=Chitinophaga horti TaxID=2920382 RepID=A0ABY6IZJ5_9BACT|nr:type IV toxin-antitoxin system AbiEi family antitoxin [Chitinophaga horti]UYQ92838.1 type IV toxin-antitoxin system AbiEi family antitoxin [Chitinophaga horti]